MKVDEAPEKIYVHVRANKGLVTTWHNTWIGVRDIEYTRTDAFIEKACEYWYQYNRDIVKKAVLGCTVNVEGFRKYMEE